MTRWSWRRFATRLSAWLVFLLAACAVSVR